MSTYLPLPQPSWKSARHLSVVLATSFALVLTACGGGDDDEGSGGGQPGSGAPGALVSAERVNEIPAADITAALSDPESKVQGGVTPLYAVTSYRLTYRTTDKDGVPTTASGLVSVPVKAAGARSPVVSYQHATTFHENQAPSNKVEAVEPPLVLASLGYIVVSPDYVGFGAAKGQIHPYLTSAPTANAVVDMLTASDSWRGQAGVADNGQLYLAGYSEGGYATMAAHRAIHLANGGLKQRLQSAVPGAGPYDVLETLDEQLDRVGDLFPPLGAILDPGNLSKLPDSVRREVRDLLLKQMVPEDGDVAYESLFLDRYMADERELVARDHSVHLGWAPSVPVYLFHGRLDLTVPYSVSESAQRALRDAGATDVSLTDCTTPKLGHLDCVPEYFRFAVERLGRTAKDL
ncbi:prolyl oligopeptidase family serine peptidase [Ottowia sp. GY511]|uniref:Alpha/beta hydrolase family protein n=1 Tax=Ottowia flava TaxID=2675430 RepID=A0ABW4KQD7_9BURK|nr:alpha/beta hydrolase [Ottowia sp. GY511]TXK31060.1 prolyl oligopeptidase family serine peptidase [Ottowia sp. GY511]